VLPYGVLELRYCFATDGRSPFGEWFSRSGCRGEGKGHGRRRTARPGASIKSQIGGRAARASDRLGSGISGRDGNVLVILLTGGTKKRQQRDIETAMGPMGRLHAAQAARTLDGGEDGAHTKI
jgi:hypothetical protein